MGATLPSRTPQITPLSRGCVALWGAHRLRGACTACAARTALRSGAGRGTLRPCGAKPGDGACGERGGRGRASLTAALAVALAAAAGAPACGDEPAPAAVTFADVAPVLAARCAGCHGVPGAGGFDVASPRGLLGCTADGRSVRQGAPWRSRAARRGARPRRPPRRRERRRARGAGGVGGSGRAAHPRRRACCALPTRGRRTGTPRSFGETATRRYARRNHADACGVCHGGAVASVPAPTPAPGAVVHDVPHGPAGRSPAGRATATGPRLPAARSVLRRPRRGSGGSARAPREGDRRGPRLRLRRLPSDPRAGPLRRSPRRRARRGLARRERVAGAGARWDAATRTCTGTCHARGALGPWWVGAWARESGAATATARPRRVTSGRLSGSCRGVATPRPTRAASRSPVGPLHLNGRVDVGDGSGRLRRVPRRGRRPVAPNGGAPRARRAHRRRARALRDVPRAARRWRRASFGSRPGARRARGARGQGGSRARYDAASGSCAETYCHAGSGGTRTSPRWTDGSAGATCTACHGAPPPPPHAARGTCGEAGCHAGATTETGAIAPAWAAVHVNGVVDRAAP